MSPIHLPTFARSNPENLCILKTYRYPEPKKSRNMIYPHNISALSWRKCEIQSLRLFTRKYESNENNFKIKCKSEEITSDYHFMIQVNFNNIRWKCGKRFDDFRRLHQELYENVVRLSYGLSNMMTVFASNKVKKNNEETTSDDDIYDIIFPSYSEVEIKLNSESRQRCAKDLTEYLNILIRHRLIVESLQFAEFLNYSLFTLAIDLDNLNCINVCMDDELKKEQMKLNKLNFMHHPSIQSIVLKHEYLKRYHEDAIIDIELYGKGRKEFGSKDLTRFYVAIRDTYIGILTYNYRRTSSDSTNIRLLSPLLFNNNFKFEKKFRHINIQTDDYNHHHQLKFDSIKKCLEFYQQMCLTFDKYLLQKTNRFDSFAPQRSNGLFSYFLCGKDYFSAVADAILKAREQIFITDWFFSPELFLKRPPKNKHGELEDENDKVLDARWQLINLLEEAAIRRSVHVYILIYKEIEITVGLCSLASKRKLNKKLNHYIQFMRHPEHAPIKSDKFVLNWSHHEKMVVIDQCLAFMGGFDLAFGRWDDTNFRLVDLPNGMNIRNIRTMSERWKKLLETSDSIEMNNLIPMAQQLRVRSNTLKSKFPTFHHHHTSVNSSIDEDDDDEEEEDDEDEEEEFEDENSQDEEPEKDVDLIAENRYRELNENLFNEVNQETDLQLTWMGKDYYNGYFIGYTEVNKAYDDAMERTSEHRMPWKDAAIVMAGPTARDLARHFIQHWNNCRREKKRDSKKISYLLPKSNVFDVKVDGELNGRKFLDNIFEFYLKNSLTQQLFHVQSCQMLRSCGEWSIGTKQTEYSIANAMEYYIEKAKKYIYIENQFYISIIQDKTVKNNISIVLAKRILKAFHRKESFHVYLIIPLMPMFSEDNKIQVIYYYQNESINSIKSFLYEYDMSDDDIDRYLSIYSLRNWDIIMEQLTTEIIYVHTKLMIVDDKNIVIGSANINDRSLLGDRDSEIGISIEDKTFAQNMMRSTFSVLLNGSLYGLKMDHMESDEAILHLRELAQHNTNIYKDVFHCIPDDEIRSSSELDKFRKNEFSPQNHKELSKLKGFLVNYSLNYLSETIKKTRKKSPFIKYLPAVIWT